MREAHPLSKRVAETLDIGNDEDLFGWHDQRPSQTRPFGRTAKTSEEPSFGDALLGLLGSTTAGSMG